MHRSRMSLWLIGLAIFFFHLLLFSRGEAVSGAVELHVDHTKIDENLTNFPLRVHLGSQSGISQKDLAAIFNEFVIDVNDDFTGTDGSLPNSTRWYYAGNAVIQGDKLRQTNANGTGSCGLRPKFVGDFDVQVDFSLVTYPATYSWTAELKAIDQKLTNQQVSVARRYTGGGGHKYSFLYTNAGGTQSELSYVVTSDISGKLRLTRSGSVFTGYYWTGSTWAQIGQYNYSAFSSESGAELMTNKWDSNPTAVVDWDNFTRNSGTLQYNYGRKRIAVFAGGDQYTGKKCFVEIENWDSVNREADLHVWVPAASSTEDTVLWLYYDSTQPNQDVRTVAEGGDDFAGTNADPPDSHKWYDPIKAQIQNNKLRISCDASGLGETLTRYWLRGDFDIQVDFSLVTYPTINSWDTILSVVAANANTVEMNIRYNLGSRAYHSQYWDGSWHELQRSATSDTSGKFRLVRSGTTITCYYWNGSSWVSFGSNGSAIGSNDVRIRLRQGVWDNNPSSTADLDNLVINSASSITGFVGDTASAPAQEVWDSNFKAVYHMAQDPTGGSGAVKDSTRFSKHLTATNMEATDLVEGKAGKGLNLDGVAERLAASSVVLTPTADHTIEALFNFTDQLNEGDVRNIEAQKDVSGTGRTYLCIKRPTGETKAKLCTNLGNSGKIANTQLDPAIYYFGGYSYDAAAQTASFFLNAADDGTGTSVAAEATSGALVIGADKTETVGFWYGLLDEMRISSVKRSLAWRKATYYSLFDDLIFYATTDTTPPPAVNTLTVNGNGDGTTVSLDWTGYDESAAGDVVEYRIYSGTSPFTSLSGLTPVATVSAGTFTYTLRNLTKGATYYFAVVAVDSSGNALGTVSGTVPGVPTDITPPEEVTNLRVESFETRLILSWDPSANSAGDLAGYKVYFNGAAEGVDIAPTQNTFEQTGLSPATGYGFRVTAYDTAGNETSGVSFTGITLLENPSDVSATRLDRQVHLTWSGAQPAQYVRYYNVYVSQTAFASVDGMTPRLTTSDTSVTVSGLRNNLTYYFAVTTVNLSDGEKKAVSTISTAPYVDPTIGTQANPGLSALHILESGGSTGDGVYWIDPDGSGAFQAYCDMTTDGGGWTLVMKINGNNTTFQYDSAYWTNTTLYNANYPGFDTTEAKLKSFNVLAFSEVLLGIRKVSAPATETNWMIIPQAAASFRGLMNGGYVPTNEGRNGWLAFFDVPIQPYCNKEGFNVAFGYASSRIGLVANQENDCSSCDSVIGLGNRRDHPWGIYYAAGGGIAGQTTPAYGWILVREAPGQRLPPHLVTSAIDVNPANPSAGQQVTFTATIANSGEGSVVYPFQVNFLIDGASIGTKNVSQILDVGESLQVTQTWTALVGTHTVQVVADSAGQVAESDETNNSLSQALPPIGDTTAPELVSTDPASGSVRKQVTKIVITLREQYGGTVDDAAVMASITVTAGGGGSVSGTVAEANDQFTFTPAVSPLPDGAYTVSFIARNTAGDSENHSFSFTVDSQAPLKPIITGGTVATGVIQVRPFENRSNTTALTLTGTREAECSVWINNTQRVVQGTGDWSVPLTLSQGTNTLEIWLVDAAGNRSDSEWVDILVDSVAPAITSVTPAEGTFLNASPLTVVVTYQEATSGLNVASSTHVLRDAAFQEMAGTWATSGGNQLVFTPAAALPESAYTLSVQLQDNLGNSSALGLYHFTVDTTPPPAPVVNPVQTPTVNPKQTIAGSKEAYASITLNGQEVVGHTAETTWQYEVTLTAGQNQLVFTAKDRAGNQSEPVPITILFDDQPPPAVSTLTVNGKGDGTTASLDWSGYNESGQGDIASYRIYVESASFSSLAGLTAKGTVAAGHFTYTVQGLTKGATYWFAVVAVDGAGNVGALAAPISATITDIVPPEEVTNLRASSFETRLVFTWTQSANTKGDLAGYKVYFNNAAQGTSIPSTQATFEQTGLAPATGYPFRVTALDTDGNESQGVTVTGITWLQNPAGVTVRPQSGYVDLTWSPSDPAQYVKRYQVYVSDATFATVEGMTPRVTSTTTSARVSGLTNNVAYYFAVTAVNLSDGERKTVAPVSGTPIADAVGPEVTDVRVDTVLLTSGTTVRKPATFTARASDPSGVSRLEFSIDGALIRTDYNGSPTYFCYWNIVSAQDGTHTLTIVAYDTLGNSTTVQYTVVAALDPPQAPTITQPAGGAVVNQPALAVSGYAEKQAEVLFYLNDAEVGSAVSVDALGNFTTTFTLAPEENRIQAAARNRAGTGPRCAEVLVTLDTTKPQVPTNVSAESREGGTVRVSWQAPADTTVKGYNLYRAAASFATPGQAVRVNTALISATSMTDLPATDGTYYYRVASVNAANNESDLSAETSALSDRVMPSAVSILYTPRGKYDPATGRIAAGAVDVLLTVSEALQAVPYLSITPEGGVPLGVELSKHSDTEYGGLFTIGPSTPSGTAYAVFSARDVVGNRGTEIASGGTIRIDTEGPAVARISLSPGKLIKNDEQNPVTVTATIGLTEAVKPGTAPSLSYLLSGQGRSAISLSTLTQVSPQTGEAQAWQGAFTLPADAGKTAPESFSFSYSGMDDLDNLSQKVSSPNLFQVYQGVLPPLGAPEDLKAQALPGGKVKLTWKAVDSAAGYELFRKAPGEADLTAYQRLATVIEYTDTASPDGTYAYAIASIRVENNDESVSGMSAPVEVASDSVAPPAPTSLVLTLQGSGIKADWQAPATTDPLTYSLYRANVTEIVSVEGMTPIASAITATTALDSHPSPTEHCYVVCAVDGAGNVSAPSNSFYLNFGLLPVSSVTVVQQETNPPSLSWTHPGGTIAGYDLYLGPDAKRVKLNQGLLTTPAYTDTGYAGDERRYTVVAVDVNGEESVGRSVTLPVVQAKLAEGTRINRGVMNRMEYSVENRSSIRIENASLKVRVEGHDHTSEAFAVDPGSTSTVPVTVGGYPDLPDSAILQTTVEITPNPGEKVDIIRGGEVPVGDGMLVLGILNETFLRGASGTVRFTLENTGAEEIEIVTATGSGSSPSNEVVFSLLDGDGNVLSSKKFKQTVGDKIVTLANGTTVARIPAGGIFTSEALEIAVPQNAPDKVTIRLQISSIRFHTAKPDQVVMAGLSGTHEVALIDTSYYGEVTSINPQSSAGDRDIVISGRAIERATGLPLSGVPLDLVISVSGFDRTNKIFTESDGTFTYTFTPMAGEAGVYTVGAVHPDLLDRPVQGQFVISRVSVSPTTINLSIPWNYERTMTVRVETTEGTQATNLRIEYRAEDQTGGAFPAGIHLTPGAPIASLGSRQSGNLSFSLWADTDATEIGKVVLKVRSDESGEGAWGTVVVNTHFSQAVPVLSFTPDHVETGVAHDDTVFETVVLENKGLAALDGVALALVSADGTPAPSWVRLNSAATLGAIAVGEKREVTLSFSPTAALAAEGSYSFKLKVTAANYPETPINIYCMVTQSGIGSALFKVTDIYTGSVASGGGVVQGLAGAKITLQNEVNLTITSNQTTDSFGESMFRDLPAGTYKFRVTAADHQERIGRLWIKPGVTTSQEVFLDYNLVTVEWEVKETTIQDKYDIVLTTTYKTDVPAAVVVAQPASVTLPAMKTGDVYNGEFTLTNYGLIRAEKVTFTLPTDDPHFRYELLGGLPTTIEAKQRITVPYRVTCVQSPTQQGEGTGGGCERSMRCIVTGYQYVCINGVWTLAATNYCFTYDNGQCTGGTGSAGGGGIPPLPPSGGGTGYYGGPGTGGGTVSASPAPAPKPIAGVKCFPQCKRKECDQCCPKENEQDCCEPVLSRVRLTFREYNLDEADLAVKVPGGAISVGRRFYGDAWHFEHERHNFTMKREMFVVMGAGGGTAAGSVLSIDKGGVEYERESTSPLVLVNDTYRITQTGPDTAPTGYRWEDKNGSWKEYETTGETSARVTSYGTANGVVGKVLYEPGENGRALGISDRNDRQVIWFEYGPDGKLSAARDLTNRRVEYGYTEGRLSSVKDVLSHETLYDYDTKGRITKVTHPVSSGEGRVATVAYDDYGGVSSVLDNNGNGWFFDYDYDQGKNEFYARIRTSAGKVKEIWYDKDYETKRIDVNGRTIKRIVKDGRSLAITDENGNVSRKDYDEWENLTRVINPDGSEVTNEYEHAHNRLAKSTNERGVVTRYTYDGAGNLLRKTEAEGTPSERVTEYTYDSDGNRLSTKVLGDASTAEALTAMTYDANGNMATLTDAEGNVTRFTTHDVMGNVLTKEDARGKVWTYGYDDAGRPTSVRDPLTNLTEIFYDELGNKQREVDAEGKETKYEYDVRGNMTKRTDALGNSTLFTYNPDGKLVKQTDAEGKEVRYEYDLDGRLKKTIDGNGNETSLEYESGLGSSCSACSGAAKEQPSRITYPTFVRDFRYDSRGRKVEELDILSATEKYTTTFSYDSAGNLISKKDKEEKTTSYEYDELNRLKRVIDPLSQGTEYTYDDRNNLIALKDAKEQVTRFQYDRNNRLVREIRPLGQETSYEYDPAGNLERKVDAKNQKIEYGYDDAGRLTETRYYTAFGDTTPVKTITLTHDKVGNLKTYNDGTTSGAYGYDDVHRKTSESVDYGSFSLAYAYDYYKNGMKKSFTGPDGAAYQYTYDDANQLASVAIPNQGSITFSSYLWNRPTAVVLPGGSRREYSYDPLMRTQTITVKDPLQNAIMGYTYAYDKMDNIKGKATEHGPYAYDYDELYRLKTADNPTISDEAFTYDAVGNRVTSAGVTGSWNYNANNELSEYDGVSFEYDANGNTTRKTGDGTVTVFAYDVDNRMVRVEDGSGSVIATYYYDPFGRRLWKEVGGTRTNFVHADEGLVGEYDAAGAEIKTYGYRPDSTWTTDPLFMKQAGEYFFYQNDHLGTPQKITNVNGSVVWSAKYESFGMAQVEAGSTVENNLRFPGQYYDTETGLCYNWHRYYDPRVGRYLTEDPKGFEDGLNFYLYGRNNPILNMDPFGLFGLSSCADEAIGKCGRPIICFAKAIYLPICGIVCGLLIRNPWVCIIGCPLYTAYKIVKCINELQDCLDKNMKECCSKPGSEYDYSCDCYVQKQNK